MLYQEYDPYFYDKWLVYYEQLTAKDHLLLAPCLAEPHLTDQRYSFPLENKQKLNINIASFFLETLVSPNEKTWHDTGGPITQTINYTKNQSLFS